jgi:hypothetical protein
MVTFGLTRMFAYFCDRLNALTTILLPSYTYQTGMRAVRRAGRQ